MFLYQLQLATVIEDQQTTDINILAALAAKFGLNKTKFIDLMQSQELEKQLIQFQNLVNQLKIEQLPAFSLEYQGKIYVVKGIVDYDGWLRILNQITDHKLKEQKIKLTISSLKNILAKYQIISELELKSIFNLTDMTAFNKLIGYLAENNEIKVETHKAVRFFKKAGI